MSGQGELEVAGGVEHQRERFAVEGGLHGGASAPIAQNTVSRMIMGGLAGLRTMIAFPRRAPPTDSIA